ncbi:hypothetical protein L9F63_023358, partial [Diploptera punctata]
TPVSDRRNLILEQERPERFQYRNHRTYRCNEHLYVFTYYLFDKTSISGIVSSSIYHLRVFNLSSSSSCTL